MTDLDPSFDPATGTWYLPDRPQEARTIAELIKLLPKGQYRVPNYYPLGAPAPQIEREGVLSGQAKKKAPRPKDHRVPGKINLPLRRKTTFADRWVDPETVEKVLNLWADGVSGVEIAAQLGLTPQRVAANIVPKARELGDPRAVIRNPKSFGRARKEPPPSELLGGVLVGEI